ncbi:hypothetical protein SAMN05519103_09043 [Rhizobiales bacterium GAS113]|nr:hypothetical protein SAMN05519103_09043 [Rhizobiales bacterium GAS113]
MQIGKSYDPDTVKLISTAFDGAWSDLEAALGGPLSESVADTAKAAITRRILTAVDAGERDAARLKSSALSGIVMA